MIRVQSIEKTTTAPTYLILVASLFNQTHQILDGTLLRSGSVSPSINALLGNAKLEVSRSDSAIFYGFLPFTPSVGKWNLYEVSN